MIKDKTLFDEQQTQMLTAFYDAGASNTGIEICDSLIYLIDELKEANLSPEFFIDSLQHDLKSSLTIFREALVEAEQFIDEK